MGVQSLWEVLQDVKTSKSLSDLKGETLAVDLAAWICEAETVRHMQDTVRCPFIRNLFFRISSLLAHDIKMIFVIDGRPPKLKHGKIAERQGNAFGRFSGARSGLNAKFKECCFLLDQIGIPWIKADGEAEATCAALNSNNIVSACVTDDGDAFLYGAVKVYRNFSTDKKGETISCYKLEEIQSKLNLERKSLITFALLLGCDYTPGLNGIGKVQALEYLKSCAEKDPISCLKELVNDEADFALSDKKPAHCSICKHIGSRKYHLSNQCEVCGIECKLNEVSNKDCTCKWHQLETQRKWGAIKFSIREKAKKVQNFPCQKVIDEFLKKPKIPDANKLTTRCPSLIGMVACLSGGLGWTVETCVKKSLPLLTKWILSHPSKLIEAKPARIVKERKRNGVQVFEVEWDLRMDDVDCETTFESQEDFKSAFPKMVADFLSAKHEEKNKKSKKESKKSPKKLTDFFPKKKSSAPQNVLAKPADDVIVLDDDDVVVLDDVAQTASSSSPGKRDVCLDELGSALRSISLNEPLAGDSPSKEQHSPEAEISFDLNFSLGVTKLYPTEQCQPEAKTVGRLKECDVDNKENEFGFFTEAITSSNESSNDDEDPAKSEPNSPVFMTLAERIRQKK